MPIKNLRQADQPETPVIEKPMVPEPTVSTLPEPAEFAGSESTATEGPEPARLRLLPPVSAPSSLLDPLDRSRRGELPRRSPDDAVVHRESRPKFCPNCGEAYELHTPAAGIVVEFWTSRNRVFHCWCASCGEAFDITDANLVVTEEIEH
jgi:hypothetical protein